MEEDRELDVLPSTAILGFRFEEAKMESLAEASSVEGSKRVGKKRQLRKLATENRASLVKMSQEQQSKTCAICLDEMTPQVQAQINSCKHVYCFVCINQWV